MNLPDLVQNLVFTVSGLKETEAQTKSSLGGIGRAVDDMQKHMGIAGKTVRTVFAGFGNATKQVVGDVVHFATTLGATAGAGLIAFGEKSALAAGRVQELDLVLGVLGKNAGVAKSEIDKQVKGVRDMGIEYGIAQSTIADMMKTQMDVTKASQLARVAQDAAVISMGNSSDTLQSLMWGIQTGQTDVLRNAGITVNLGKAYDDYAKTLGIAANDMTGAQKQQAALNAVLEAGKSIAGAYSVAMETPGKQLRSLPRYINDVQVAVGTAMLPAFTNVVGIMTDVVKGFDKLTAAGTPVNKMLAKLGAGVGEKLIPVRAAIRSLFTFLESPEGGKAIQNIIDKVGDLASKFGGLIKIVAPFAGVFASSFLRSIPIVGGLVPPLGLVTALFGTLVLSSKDLRDSMVNLGKAMVGVGTSGFKAITDAIQGLAKVAGDTLGGIIKQITPQLAAFAGVLSKELPGIVKALGEALKIIGPAIGNILSAGLSVITKLFGDLSGVLQDLAPLIADAAAAFGDMLAAIITAVGPPLERIVAAIGTMAKAVLPEFTSALRGLTPIVAFLGGTAFSVLATVLEDLAKIVVPLAPYIGTLAAVLLGLRVFREVSGYAQDFVKSLTGGKDVIGGFTGGVSKLVTSFGDARTAGAGLSGGMLAVGSSLLGSIGPQIALTAVTAVATYGIMKFVQAKEAQRARIKTVTDALKDESKSIADNMTTAAQNLIVQRHQDDDLARIGISYKTYSEAINGNVAAQQTLRQAMVGNLNTNGKYEVQLATMQKGTGVTTKLTAEQTDQFIKNGQVLDEQGNKIDLLVPKGQGLYNSIQDNTTATQAGVQAKLNDAAASGAIEQADYKRLTQMNQLKNGTVDYQGILKDLDKTEADHNATSQDTADALSKVTSGYDDAGSAAQSYQDIIDKTIGRTIDSEQSNIHLEQSLATLNQAQDKNTAGLAKNGALTLEGRDKFSGLAKSVLDNVSANIKNGESLDKATDRGKANYLQLVATMGQYGVNNQAAVAYLATLGLTPASIATDVKMTGTQAALTKLGVYLDNLKLAKPEQVTVLKALLDKGDLNVVLAKFKEFGIPIPKEIQLLVDTKKATPDLKKVADTKVAPKVAPKVDTKTPTTDLKKIADTKVAPKVTPTVDTATPSKKMKTDLTDPKRTAVITAKLTGQDVVIRQLNDLTKDRHVKIIPTTVQAPGQAEGGPVFANRLYTVGEKGPELFVPSQSGTVLPANHPVTRLAAKMGALQFVDPSPQQHMLARPVGVGVAGAGGANNNLAIGAMNVYQDLDMDVALTRIGMAMSGASL